MRPVERAELLDYATYEDRRHELRALAMEVKRRRRVHVGKAFTLLFENRDTVRYQVQEMMRAEKLVREADIQHELLTYNELLGAAGELGATFLIEIDDADERRRRLAEWTRLPEHLYLRLADGTRVLARWDERQIDPEKISSVQFLKFPVGGRAPVAIGVDLPGHEVEAELTEEQRAALTEDLA